MKMKTMTALAVVMLAAGSLPAAAQERGERGERGHRGGGEGRVEARQDRPRADGGERRREWSGGERTRAIEAPPAPQAAEAPRAPEAAPAPRARRAGGDNAQDLWRSDRQRGERRNRDVSRPGRWTDNDGDDRTNVSPADQADREDRDEARDARRWNGGDVQWDGRNLRTDGQRTDGQRGDRHRDGQRDGDRDGRRDGRRDGDRDGGWDRGAHDGDRRDRDGRSDGRWDGRWTREDRDRWDRNDRDRDRRRGDRPYWSQGRYPFSYHSGRRYRGPSWVAPSGFYIRSWSYGDQLPWSWYGASYRLNDWYAYGLPWPPPGFDWVRVGPDVLLVDRFTGRVMQVVRGVFW